MVELARVVQTVEDQAAAAAATAAQEYVARSASGSSLPAATASAEAADAASPSAAVGDDSPAAELGGSGSAAAVPAAEPAASADAPAAGGTAEAPAAWKERSATSPAADSLEGSDAGHVAARAKSFGSRTSSGSGTSSGAGSRAGSTAPAPAAEVADIDGGTWMPRSDRPRAADGRPKFDFGGLKELAETPPTATVSDLDVKLELKPAAAPAGQAPPQSVAEGGN